MHSCSHGTAVHDASVNLVRSISPYLPYHPLSVILDDPSVLALRLPPAIYSSLEIMYTAVQATIYMCSQHGISLQLCCKPVESLTSLTPRDMVLCSESPFDLWRQSER